LTASACGTTVPKALRASGGANAQDLGGVAGSGEAGSGQAGGAQSAEAGGPGIGVQGSAATQVGPAGAAHSGGPVAAAGSPADIPRSGRGWDANSVYIGMIEAKDKSQTTGSMGLNNTNTGDNEAQANAVAKYYNDRGGLFGRKIVMRFDDHHFAATLSQPDTEAQEACTRFTQDQPVIAVLNPEGGIDVAPSLRACFAKAGIPLFSEPAWGIDDERLRQSNGLYIPAAASWTRFASVLVDGLVAQGYFGGWNASTGGPGAAPVRVGVIGQDDPDSSRASDDLVRALTQAGHAPVVVYKYGNYASDANSEVLKMRSNNVTHVIVLDASLFVFATAAEAQHYRPRYGVHSANAPSTEAGIAPAGQNVGAVGVGYQPTFDIATQSGELTPGGGLCRGIMTANGQTFAGKRYAESYAMEICDWMRLVAESALSARGFTRQAILAGLGTIGPSFASALTFASGLKPPYPILPGAARDLQYQMSCSCFAYTDPTLHPF
jgi:hypothetical protein